MNLPVSAQIPTPAFPSRRRRRLVIGIGVLLFAIVPLTLFFFISIIRPPCPNLRRSALTQIRSIATAAVLFDAENPGKCPTLESLVKERYLDNRGYFVDPWDSPYIIECATHCPPEVIPKQQKSPRRTAG